MTAAPLLVGCAFHDGADIDACGCPALDSPGAIAYRGLLVKARAEIARLTAELAAARAVPADVEAAIVDLKIAAADFGIAQDGVTGGLALATEHRGEASTRMRSAVDSLRTAIARAISDATDKRDAEWQKRIAPLHPNRTGDGCDSGDPIDWTFAALMLARIDAESDAHDEGHRAAMRDATAARGTVGGLLATAPVGSIVESGSDSVQYRSAEIDPGCRDTGNVIEVRTFAFGAWSTWTRGAYDISYSLHLPARLVPAAEADASPESRGPLPKGG